MSVVLKVEATHTQILYILILFINYCFLKALEFYSQETPGEKYLK